MSIPIPPNPASLLFSAAQLPIRPDLFIRSPASALYRLNVTVGNPDIGYRTIVPTFASIPSADDFLSGLPEWIDELFDRYPDMQERFVAGELTIDDIIDIREGWRRV